MHAAGLPGSSAVGGRSSVRLPFEGLSPGLAPALPAGDGDTARQPGHMG